MVFCGLLLTRLYILLKYILVKCVLVIYALANIDKRGGTMFIGRKNELDVLNETYNKPGFQMTVIYGRRRIGKSRLITEFIKDKKSSYYVGSRSSLEDNLTKWSEQVIDDLFPNMSGVSFQDLESFFKFIGNSATEEKLIIAIDEIPYIAESDDSFLSQMQKVIDTIIVNKNIYLIICGSAISFMEKEILSEKSPLFGRRTNQIFLKPFNYLEAAEFTPSYTCEEKAVVYGITGGVAKYLTLFDDSISLDENIINNYFKPSGYLYEEPLNLLTQEFRTINTYNSVIEVCAGGANRVNEIAGKAHISTATLSYVLKSLCLVGIVSKVIPMGEKENKKKITYEITDGMYRFWYSFVSNARSAIEMNKGGVYYYNNVKNNLHAYMGSVFEDMCRYYALSQGLSDKLNCLVTNVGSWWGNDKNGKPTDIDVVGIDDASKKIIIGECKFRNEVIDKEVYETLIERSGLVNNRYKEVQYLLFSLSGFSKWVHENADDNVRLISINEMYE